MLAGVFYDPLYPFIMAHNYSIYEGLLNIIGIDSTFIKTMAKGSGRYTGENTQYGIKMHNASIVFPLAVPIESIVTPANTNGSIKFDGIVNNIDGNTLERAILAFDLGYYSLKRFKKLNSKGIMFRIKGNAVYEIIKEHKNSKIIRFSNGLELRLVTLLIDKDERNYITNIMDVPDIYIHYIYSQRWSIEIFFRRMKSLLKNVNGIMLQIFASLIAYIILSMMQSLMAYSISLAEILRMLRNVIKLPFKTGKSTAKNCKI